MLFDKNILPIFHSYFTYLRTLHTLFMPPCPFHFSLLLDATSSLFNLPSAYCWHNYRFSYHPHSHFQPSSPLLNWLIFFSPFLPFPFHIVRMLTWIFPYFYKYPRFHFPFIPNLQITWFTSYFSIHLPFHLSLTTYL